MHADKNLGRLLLLCVRTSGVQTESRVQLRQNGITNDRGDQVNDGRQSVIYNIVIIEAGQVDNFSVTIVYLS